MKRSLPSLAGAAALGAVILTTFACESETTSNPQPADAGTSDAPENPSDAGPVVDCPAPTKGPTLHKDGLVSRICG